MNQHSEHERLHESATAADSFFSNLLQAYTPRQQCMNDDTTVVWLHIASDSLIALSYFSIPIALLYFIRRRRDVAFSWMFVMFAVFILACGTTHVFGVAAIWKPLYKIDGLVKLATALVSVATAIYLWKLMPTALALPSPAQLRESNTQLELEILQREKAQASQAALQVELETRVESRTRELAERNDALRAEIGAREEAERERNRLLASARAARDDAERANRTKDEFLATLSHELRTPLNAIQGWSQLLRRGDLAGAEFDRGLEVIERNARIQTQLIEDLLDMSRILSNKLRLELQPVDVGQIVSVAVASIRPSAQSKGIDLFLDIATDLPHIHGDPNRLQQVVWNLLSNAIKFTPRTGVVHVAVRASLSSVEVRVRDTGQGISSEFMPRLFERFTQADSTTTRTGAGLGLGLSIVRHLIELHGGTVSAESAGEGHGATFTVELPRSRISREPAPRQSDRAAEPALEAQTVLNGVRILLVDDEPDAREVVRRMLELYGAEVMTAASVDDAWIPLRDFRPSIVVSDIGMPGQDGYSFIRALRRLSRDEGGQLPAVALTAFASSEDRRRVLDAGFQMHVVKPVEVEELVAVIASLTGRIRG